MRCSKGNVSEFQKKPASGALPTEIPTMDEKDDIHRKTTCKVFRIPKAIEWIWSRQRLMKWFRVVMTLWMYEREKRLMSRITEAYQSFQLARGPGFYKRAFLTHRNAVTTAMKRVAGALSVTEAEKREVLRADIERNLSLCLHNSFCRNLEQKVNVELQTRAVRAEELGHGPQLRGHAGESPRRH